MADGVFSTIDELTGAQTPFLSKMRFLVGMGVLVASFGMTGVMAMTPQTPKRVLLPLIGFVWWITLCDGVPFGHLPHRGLIFALAQVALGAGIWARYRRREEKWFSPFADNEAPFFRWKYSLVAAPLAAVVFFSTIFASIFIIFSSQLEKITGGYLRLKPDGLYLTERQFQSGDHQVNLAGMMHIADDKFYTQILPQADPAQPSVVLVEGVSDSKQLLGHHGLSYGKMAQAFKITAQEHSVFTDQIREGLTKQTGKESIVFKRADVDISAFRPQTITFLLAVGALFDSKDWQEVAQKLLAPSSPLTDEKEQLEVMHDILDARNEKLTGEIETSLKEYKRVIVPWGALHLKDIEAWLKQRNFVESKEIERKALGFW